MAGRHTARNIPLGPKHLVPANEDVTIVGQTVDRTTLTIEDRAAVRADSHIEVYHNSASPANGDKTGGYHFMSLNSVLTSIRFANLDADCAETAPGIHNGTFQSNTMNAGVASNTTINVANGWYDQALTDGGYGNVNFVDYKVNGQQMLLSRFFVSLPQTITAAGLITVAHGLGAVPTMIDVRVQCLLGEDAWVITDETNLAYQEAIFGIYADATNINIRVNSGIAALAVMFNKTTGALSTFTLANWQLIARAWL